MLRVSPRSKSRVRFPLGATPQPVAVSTYTYDALPANERKALPPEAALAEAITPETTER
jgi:hypothetical protein